MIKLLLIISPIILIFYSCSSIQEINEDEILREKIIGTWSVIKGTESISFYEDGKYTDSIFSKLPGFENQLFPEYIIDGNFRTKNRILEFLTAEIKYLLHSEKKIIEQYEIKMFPRTVNVLDDGDLIMQNIQFVELINGVENEIKGKWKSEYLTTQYFRNSDVQFKSGIVEEFYNFTEDSLTLIRNYKFNSDFNNKPFTAYYTLNNRILIADSLFTVASIFREKSMLWYVKDPVIYRKIN